MFNSLILFYSDVITSNGRIDYFLINFVSNHNILLDFYFKVQSLVKAFGILVITFYTFVLISEVYFSPIVISVREYPRNIRRMG